ncbi:ATP-binding protein [Flavisolibacter nicotianae]|uniref:ATP-binding protein n=1 Tax=Flavisolibacter nicotianae TaxID=2364882 RepID=UPI0013C45E04|nr:ATP-binding protein [Flavisolibacter nicotianae]
MLKESVTENLIAQLFDSQPDSVVWFVPVFDSEGNNVVIDFEARYCNHSAAQILGISPGQVVGGRLQSTSLLDDPSVKLIFQQCLEVWRTGEPLEHSYYSPGFERYFNVQRRKVDGGILSISRDRTREVRMEIDRQEQEKMYQHILDSSADGVMLLKSIRNKTGRIVDFYVTHCNRKGLEWGQFPPDAVGKKLLELLPHLKFSEQFDLHKSVVESGLPVRFETTFKTPGGEEYGWFMVSLSRLGDGVISSFVDITEKKVYEQQILEQKNLLNNILDASLNAVYTCEAVRNATGNIVDFRFVQVNQRFRELSVRPEIDVIGKNLLEEFPATRQTIMVDKLVSVINTGKAERFEVHYRSDHYDGWYDTCAVKLGENSVVVTFTNITDQKQAALEVEQQKDMLDKILRFSPSSISVLKAIRNAEGEVIDFQNVLVNDLAVQFTGISRQDLLNRSNAALDPAFLQSPLFHLLSMTLQTGESCYTDYRLPTGKWIEGAASKMDREHLICVTTDVTQAKESQQRMQSLLDELKRSNESLEEFTRAASHDMKEPIRKVQFFADRLKGRLEGRLSEEEKSMMERMETAASRMKLLVDDLLEYAHVNAQPAAEMEDIDLNKKVKLVLSDLELMVTEKKAKIDVGLLPVVKGHRRQLQQLFHNLLSNAIKYAKPGIEPVVTVSAHTITGGASGFSVATMDAEKLFHLIEVADNGIGFEQEYADRIFNVFTRLHGNSEYDGTGVGLAIVRKVVENHHGYISAESSPGVGTTFRVLLPA